MKEAIETAIKILAEKTKSATPQEALHYTQAALNLAHVLQVQKQTEVTK